MLAMCLTLLAAFSLQGPGHGPTVTVLDADSCIRGGVLRGPGFEWLVGSKFGFVFSQRKAGLYQVPLWEDPDHGQRMLGIDRPWRFVAGAVHVDPEGFLVLAGDFGDDGVKRSATRHALAIHDLADSSWTLAGRMSCDKKLRDPVPQAEGLTLVPGGAVVVVGTFNGIDDQPAPGVAIFNPRTKRWRLPKPDPAHHELVFHSAAVVWGRVFLGGPAGLWELGADDALRQVPDAPEGRIYALRRHRGGLLLAGQLKERESNVQVFDGTTWNALGAIKEPVFCLDAEGERLVAGGEELLALFDGTNWLRFEPKEVARAHVCAVAFRSDGSILFSRTMRPDPRLLGEARPWPSKPVYLLRP